MQLLPGDRDGPAGLQVLDSPSHLLVPGLFNGLRFRVEAIEQRIRQGGALLCGQFQRSFQEIGNLPAHARILTRSS